MSRLEKFKEEYYEKFPNNELEIIEYNNSYNILVKNKYGVCRNTKGHLLLGSPPTIASAINKEEYLTNMIREKFPQNLEYFKIVKYNSSLNILIETKYGNCLVNSSNLLKGKTFSIRSSINKTEYFINQAREIHGDKYDYSLVEWLKAKQNVKIICKEHNTIFGQTSDHHLSGQGCPKCGDISVSNHLQKNPVGWTKTNWEKAAEKSKNFTGFKCYIIECWDENERFFKIGRTFKKVENRFISTTLPYQYKILKVFEGECEKMYDLENELKIKNKEYSYLPLKDFGGIYECFSKIK